MSVQKEKYLLLYLKTGGGHLAPAKPVASLLAEKGIEPVLVDGFEKAPWIVKAIVEGGYRRVQYWATWFYEMLYAVHKFRLFAWIDASIISFFVKKHIAEAIKKENPSRIIIFHFFLIQPVYSVLAEMKSDIRLYTIVTDPFTAHPLWFLNKRQNFIVFSTQLKNHCISMGIDESRIHVFPFIIDEKFSTILPPGKSAGLKEKYNIAQNRDTVLILGGGDGIPKGRKILRLLLKNFRELNIIIICGKNNLLYQHSLKVKQQGKYENLKVFGYVDFVYDLISLSDTVITKCGASTFMEILMARKIPVVTSFIWEQEKGNKDYIVQNGLGIYVKNINYLPENIKRVLNNRNFYKSNIQNAHLRNGAAEVTSFIIS